MEGGSHRRDRLGRRATGRSYILEATGNGVALFDSDNDGRLDVFLPNARRRSTATGAGAGSTSRLYRNLGGLRFEDVTEKAGLRARPAGARASARATTTTTATATSSSRTTARACSTATRRTGRFRDETADGGPARRRTSRWDTGCSFLDYDLDGDLDLAVTSYLEFDRARVPEPGSGELLPVERHPGDVRPARAALRAQPPASATTAGAASRTCPCASGIGAAQPLLRVHRGGLRLRRRRLSRPLRRLRLDAQPALPQPARRHVRGDRACSPASPSTRTARSRAAWAWPSPTTTRTATSTSRRRTSATTCPNLYHNNGDGTFEDHVYRVGPRRRTWSTWAGASTSSTWTTTGAASC